MSSWLPTPDGDKNKLQQQDRDWEESRQLAENNLLQKTGHQIDSFSFPLILCSLLLRKKYTERGGEGREGRGRIYHKFLFIESQG